MMKDTKAIKLVLWLLLTTLCIIVSPYIFYLADLERGYDATGGEVSIFLIPFLVWCIDETWSESKKSKKEVENFETNDCNSE